MRKNVVNEDLHSVMLNTGTIDIRETNLDFYNFIKHDTRIRKCVSLYLTWCMV